MKCLKRLETRSKAPCSIPLTKEIDMIRFVLDGIAFTAMMAVLLFAYVAFA